MKNGGDERSRTADLPLAKRALYQLSYTPNVNIYKGKYEPQPRTNPRNSDS